MGYEGHAVGLEDRATRRDVAGNSMELLASAHRDVGGDLVSAGGTGTYDISSNTATEIQAGSYALMDTTYAKLDIPFKQALSVLSTVISVSDSGYAVANSGLKSLGMDHGNPGLDGGSVFIVSDEHVTFSSDQPVKVGDLVRVRPAHVDPTCAYHEKLHLVQGDDVVESWDIDLRGW
jgi:D-serine deaminase-like pyridoxal phosphate-dependent protein